MEEKIREIIAKNFEAKTIEITRITEGYSHSMYEVKLDKAPFEVIIRFSNNLAKGYNLSKEKYVMELLEKAEIPIAKIYDFYFPVGKEEEGYMVLEKLKGVRLDTIWETLTEEEKESIAQSMGALLKKIHQIKLDAFGSLEEGGVINSDLKKSFKFRKRGEEVKNNLFLRQVLVDSLKDFSRLISFKILTPEYVSKIMFYLTKNLEEINYQGEPCLIHGDFMPGHIFVVKEENTYKICGVIDIEFASAYAPEYDFIKLHRAGFFEHSNLKSALESGYGKINEKAVELFRVLRDLGFALVTLECGDKELADKVMAAVEKRVDENLKV